jgi:PAS domain S-box-containing protein
MKTDPSHSDRSTIHLLFLGLAGLTLLALGLSFGLFHHLASQHEAGVVLNREIAEVLNRFHRLEHIETEADAPGNDIFVSGNVPSERKRVADAREAFRQEAASLRNELAAPRYAQARQMLDAAVGSATLMERDAYRALDAFSRGDLASASHAMAEMDQKHTRVVQLLEEATDALRAKESLAFRDQQSEFARIGQQEKIIGIALLLLTVAIVVYGRRAGKEMIAAALERETYVEQLQEREQALHTAIQQRDHQTRNLEEAQSIAGLGSWELDVATDTFQGSQELHRIFGTSPGSTLPYESFLSRLHPEDRDRVDRAIRASMGTGAPFEVEHRGVRTDGSVIVLATRGNVESDASGSPLRIYGIAHDISARRASEEELKRSEERFQLASRATNDVIWDWDLVTNALWVNEG